MDLTQTTAVSLSTSSSLSSSCKVNEFFSNVHFEGATLERIEALRQTINNFAFPHALSSIDQLRFENPGMDVYLWLMVEEPSGHPSMSGLLVPHGCTPIPACVDSRTIGADSGIGLYSLEHAGLSWTPLSSDPSHAGIYQLVSGADSSIEIEHFVLFRPNVAKMQANAAKMQDIEFQFLGHNLVYGPKDHASVDAFVSETINNIPLDNTPNTHRALKRSVEDAISAKRNAYQDIYEHQQHLIMKSFGFVSMDSFYEFDDRVKTFKIFAVEETVPHRWMNPYYNLADIAISHLDSLSLLKSRVAKSQMTVIDLGGGVNSPSFVLTMALLVDFLRCLQRTDCLQCLNALMELVPYGRLAIFLAEKGYALAKGKREVKEAFFCRVYSTLLRKVRSSTLSPPACVGDFLINFSVFAEQRGVGGGPQVINDRSLAANTLRLDPNDSSQLQISFTGIDGYHAISPSMLQRYVSTAYVPDLVIKVLSTPGNEVQVPPGHRNSAEAEDIAADNADDVDVDVRSDCTKQAILSLPDTTLSPKGKQRAMEILPNKEITFDDLSNAVRCGIRSVNIKNTPRDEDPHHLAMTDRSVMIGTASIEGSSRSHAVVIDGTKGKRGTIFDPYEGFGEVERTPAGLKKLGIESFTQAYEIQRNEIGKKRRAQLQKKTGLPF